MRSKRPRTEQVVFLSVAIVGLVLWTGRAAPARQPSGAAAQTPDSRFTQTLSLTPPSEPRLTGREFQVGLRRRLSAEWQDVPLRQLLRRLEQTQQIAILLDRRVDPETLINLHVTDLPFLQVVEQVASRVGARAASVGNVVYVGPPVAASSVGMLVETRMDELFGHHETTWERQAFSLSRKETIAWPDLATPREIVEQIATRFGLQVDGLQRLPHDLWPRAILPQVNCVEALSLVLVQFELTFHWAQQGRAVELVPIGRSALLERTFVLSHAAAERAYKRLRHQFPQLEIRHEGSRLIVRATAEQIGEVEEALRADASSGLGRNGKQRERPNQPVPLARRQFTLRVQNAPVIEIMKKLESVGVKFQYDADQLAAAGIDLSQRIDLDVQQVRGDQLVRKLFASFPLQIEIHSSSVTLKPRR